MTISSFQFTQPLLTKANFEMRSSKEEIQSSVDLHLHRSIVNIEGKNQALVELLVQLNKKENKEKEDACFVCEVAMQSMFSWSEDVSEEQAKDLLEINAPATLLSYIRPIVASLTNASPVSVYNIPYINMLDAQTSHNGS